MSATRVLAATGIMLLAAFAGCISNAGVSTQSVHGAAAKLPADWYEAPLVHDEAHNHSDIRQHQNLSTPNFQLVGYDPLITKHFDGAPAYGYGCGGPSGKTADGRVLDVVSAFQNELSFVLVDVTDHAKPKVLGEFYAKGMHTYDADITPDGKYVVLAFDDLDRVPVGGASQSVADKSWPAGHDGVGGASQSVADKSWPAGHDGVGGASAPAIGFRSACAGKADINMALPEDAAVSQGIVLVDVSDPTNPTFADWDPTPGRNLHSVSTAQIDGTTWVVGSVLGGAPRPGPLGVIPYSLGFHQLGYFAFDQIQATPAGTKLMRIATYDAPPVAAGKGADLTIPVRNGHTDVAMMKHPKDSKLYAYLADWEGGVIILDMTNERMPQLVAQWTPPHTVHVDPNPADPTGSGPCYRGAIHEVLPAPALWNDHHYLFAGQECPFKEDTTAPGGSVFVLDDTDPGDLHQVGAWHLPGETGVWTVEYQASPHYLTLVNRTLFVSDYHAGIWAADVSTDAALKAPPSIGVYLPTTASPKLPESTPTLPFDEQVDALPDGTLLVNEDTTGLYVLRFDAADPAPAAAPFPYK